MNRKALIRSLSTYETVFFEEKAFIPRFKTLLREELCYFRELLSGHMTASAWIVNPQMDATLLLHHKKLNRWLQPGGHADGDENLMTVACKEAEEETGLKKLKPFSQELFDLDIHWIPERKGVQAHFHYDVRYLFVADMKEEHAHNHESNEVKWVQFEEMAQYVGAEQSMLRMREKTKLHKANS